MSVTFQNCFTTPHSRSHSRFSFCHFAQSVKTPKVSFKNCLKTPQLYHTQKTHLPKFDLSRGHQWPIKAFEYDRTVESHTPLAYSLKFDDFLSILEFLCLASSGVVAIGLGVNSWFLGSYKWWTNKALAAQCVVLLVGLIIGSVIRESPWRRICSTDISRSRSGLSAEVASLAQKNTEATRALAVQGEILEKELGGIQKVLLAMQEQQQKQLELVLAIAKTGKLAGQREFNTDNP